MSYVDVVYLTDFIQGHQSLVPVFGNVVLCHKDPVKVGRGQRGCCEHRLLCSKHLEHSQCPPSAAHAQLSASVSTVFDVPHKHTCRSGMLPPPEELAALRDILVPRWLDECRHTQLEALARRLIETVVHTPIDESDVSLRNEIVLMSLWIDDVVKNGSPVLLSTSLDRKERTKRPDYHRILADHDLPLDDVEASKVCREYLLKPMANGFESAYELALGRTMADAAWKCVSTYSVIRVEVPYGHDEELCDTIASLFKRASLTCTFERIRDRYMHQLLRGKLTASRHAILPWKPSSPFEQLPKEYTGMAVNDLVRPFIETSAQKVCTSVDWVTISTTEVFILVFSMLQEILDHVADNVPLLSNVEIPFHTLRVSPCPIVLQSNFRIKRCEGVSFGYVHKNTIYVLKEKTAYPIPAIVMCWLETCLEVLPKDAPHAKTLKELHEAILYPERLLPSNYLYRFFFDDHDETISARGDTTGASKASKAPKAGPAGKAPNPNPNQ